MADGDVPVDDEKRRGNVRRNCEIEYVLVTVCADIVMVRSPITYSNCTLATVHIGNSVH